MSNNQQHNPIRRVNGLLVRCPSSYVWKLSDINSKDAGLTEDLTMNTMRNGQFVTIDLSWNNVTINEAASLLKAFRPEYITIEYLDALHGNYVTSEFYVSDKNAPLYNSKTGLWNSISFTVTQRTGVYNA